MAQARFNSLKLQFHFAILGAATAAHSACSKFRKGLNNPSSQQEAGRYDKQLNGMVIVRGTLNDLYVTVYGSREETKPTFNTQVDYMEHSGLVFEDILGNVLSLTAVLLDRLDRDKLLSRDLDGESEALQAATGQFHDQVMAVRDNVTRAFAMQHR